MSKFPHFWDRGKSHERNTVPTSFNVAQHIQKFITVGSNLTIPTTCWAQSNIQLLSILQFSSTDAFPHSGYEVWIQIFTSKNLNLPKLFITPHVSNQKLPISRSNVRFGLFAVPAVDSTIWEERNLHLINMCPKLT